MNRRRVFLTVMFTSILPFAFGGCGKKGPPEPPELLAPSAVRQLTVTGEPDAVVLHWNVPETNASGDDLTDLGGFYVYRSEGVKGERPDYTKIADVTLAADPLVRDYTYRDTEVKGGRSYDYQVAPYNLDRLEGEAQRTIRANFLGESTTVETF